MKNKSIAKKTSKNTKKVKKTASILGRPTKYHPRFIKMLIDYFNVSPSVIKTESSINKDGVVVTKMIEDAVDLPTFDKFTADIGVNVDALRDWATVKNKKGKLKHPDFSRAYDKCKAMQKHILVTNGLKGRYVSNFAIFVATNFTDMADRKEVDATSKGEQIAGFNYIVPKEIPDGTHKDISDS